MARLLLQGVRFMKESTTYQAILQEGLQEGLREGLQEGRAEGAIKEARKLLLRIGAEELGRPSARIEAAIAKISDLEKLEKLFGRLRKVESWQALLANGSDG
jgi:predicted transposase YdaD